MKDIMEDFSITLENELTMDSLDSIIVFWNLVIEILLAITEI